MLVKLFIPRTSFLSLGYMEILIILVSSLGIIGFIICLIMVSISFNLKRNCLDVAVHLLGALHYSSISSQRRLSIKVHESRLFPL